MKTLEYLRVSKATQETENQKHEIERFCKLRGFRVSEYIEEVVSGRKDIRKRKLWKLLDNMEEGDTLIITEVSRAGRTLLDITDFMRHCLNKKITVYITKNGDCIGDNPYSRFAIAALAFAAEIERELISSRTKEALKRKKQEGVILGRKKGRKSEHRKLDIYQGAIRKYLLQGISKSKISKVIGCNRLTLDLYIKDRILITAKN